MQSNPIPVPASALPLQPAAEKAIVPEDSMQLVVQFTLDTLENELAAFGGIPKAELRLWQSQVRQAVEAFPQENVLKLAEALTEKKKKGEKPLKLFFEINPDLLAHFFKPTGELASHILRAFKSDSSKISPELFAVLKMHAKNIQHLDLHGITHTSAAL